MSQKQILIVDDDPSLRRLLQMGLEKAGYKTLTADNGEDARKALQGQSVDLVTVDLMMPVMDGLRFLRWLRQEAGAAVPALVFSSYDPQHVVEQAQAAGATAVLKKPLRLPAVLTEVERLLNPVCHV